MILEDIVFQFSYRYSMVFITGILGNGEGLMFLPEDVTNRTRSFAYRKSLGLLTKQWSGCPFLREPYTDTYCRLDSQFIAELQLSDIYIHSTQGGDGIAPQFSPHPDTASSHTPK